DSITLGFSEYSAEVRASWDGKQLSGNYLRIRSDGTKTLKFTASPEANAATSLVSTSSPSQPPLGSYQVLFQRDNRIDDTTVAKLWNKDGVLYGTFIAPDGDYGLLVGRPAGKGFQLSRFTGWQSIAIVLENEGNTWTGKFHAASNSKPQPFI